MALTKTDFLEFLRCRKNFWLMKNDPDAYVQPELTEFEKTKISEGSEVELLARSLFAGGTLISGSRESQITQTQDLIANKESPIYQATFLTARNALARIDVLVYDVERKEWIIYEVKSSTSVKTDRKHNHVMDVAFQKTVAREAGVSVGQVFIVVLNKSYVRQGKTDPGALFNFIDVTEDVEKVLESTESEISEALEWLKRDEMDRSSCSCMYLSRNNHCSSFALLNPDVPEYSVHDISRITSKKLKLLIDTGVNSVKDVPPDFDLTPNQRRQVDVAVAQTPAVDVSKIKKTLEGLKYPIYFLDYETFSSAIPVFQGSSPHQNLPFQASVHILNGDDTLNHREFLSESVETALGDLMEFLETSSES